MEAAGLHAAAAHLLGVAGQAYLDVDLGAGHERAAAGHPLEEALGDQSVEGLPDGHPGHPEVLDELAFRRSRAARLGTLDQPPDVFPDLHVLVHGLAWSIWSRHVAHRTSLGSTHHHSRIECGRGKPEEARWATSGGLYRGYVRVSPAALPGVYSVAIACSTSSFAARRAGKTAARTPTKPAATT